MKKIRYSRRLLAASTLIAGLGVVAIGASTTLAAQPSFEQGHLSGLVEAIAERFNLSESDVQQVIDEQIEEQRALHETHKQEMLAKAVVDGKLTQAQADAISAKDIDEKAFFESLSSLDEDARHEAIKAHMEEMKDHIGGPRGEHHDGPRGAFGHKGLGRDGNPDFNLDTEVVQP